MVDFIALYETGVDPGIAVGPWPEGAPLTTVVYPQGADLAQHLGWPQDVDTLALCERHVAHLTTLVHSHVRGRGFSAGTGAKLMAADLREVILSAAARSVSSPEQSRRVEVGSVVTSPTVFSGFTLAELAVINRYRPRVG